MTKYNISQAALNLHRTINSWQQAAMLYSSAVVDMRIFINSKFDKYNFEISTEALIIDDPGIAFPKNRIDYYKQLIADNHNSSDNILTIARCLVSEIGLPLYQRLVYELLQLTTPPTKYSEYPAIARGSIGKEKYLIIPTTFAHGKDYYHESSELDERFDDQHLSDGFYIKEKIVRPPHLRVLTGSVIRHVNLNFLEFIHSSLNLRLYEETKQGINIAAIPLHHDIVFSQIIHEKKDQDNQNRRYFHLDAPALWPDQWEQELESAFDDVNHHKAIIATLPELCCTNAVSSIINNRLSQPTTNYPLIISSGSWHIQSTSRNCKTYRNVMSILCSIPKSGHGNSESRFELFTHEKFCPYEYKGENDTIIREDILPHRGTSKGGFSLLITSIGIFAFGICKDWFLNRQADITTGQQLLPHDATSLTQLEQAIPLLAVCPAMTGSIKDISIPSNSNDIKSAADQFSRLKTVFLFSNSCGTIKHMMRNKVCCAVTDIDKKLWDVSNFIFAPKNFSLEKVSNNTTIMTNDIGLLAKTIKHRRNIGPCKCLVVKIKQVNNG